MNSCCFAAVTLDIGKCTSNPNGSGSFEITQSGSTVTQKVYTSSDCTGAVAASEDSKCGACEKNDNGSGSTKGVCSDPDSASNAFLATAAVATAAIGVLSTLM